MQNRCILGIGGSAPAPTALRSLEVPFRKPHCKDGLFFTFAVIPFRRYRLATGAALTRDAIDLFLNNSELLAYRITRKAAKGLIEIDYIKCKVNIFYNLTFTTAKRKPPKGGGLKARDLRV